MVVQAPLIAARAASQVVGQTARAGAKAGGKGAVKTGRVAGRTAAKAAARAGRSAGRRTGSAAARQALSRGVHGRRTVARRSGGAPGRRAGSHGVDVRSPRTRRSAADRARRLVDRAHGDSDSSTNRGPGPAGPFHRSAPTAGVPDEQADNEVGRRGSGGGGALSAGGGVPGATGTRHPWHRVIQAVRRTRRRRRRWTRRLARPVPGARRIGRWRRRFTRLVLIIVILGFVGTVAGSDDEEQQQQQEDDATLLAVVAACAADPGRGPDADAAVPASLCPGEPGNAPAGSDLDVTTAECRVDGSTLPAQMANITSRMRAVMEALVGCFGRGRYGYGCWRGGTFGEHPLGRACDFMMSADTGPDAFHLEQGWRMANLLVERADEWGIMYVIWQDQIWNTSRRSEGWREYVNPPSCPGGITCDHVDHVHVSVDP